MRSRTSISSRRRSTNGHALSKRFKILETGQIGLLGGHHSLQNFRLGVLDLLFQRGGEIVHALGELHFGLMELFLEPMLQPVKTLIHRVETLIHPIEAPLNPPKILLQKRAKILAKRYVSPFVAGLSSAMDSSIMPCRPPPPDRCSRSPPYRWATACGPRCSWPHSHRWSAAPCRRCPRLWRPTRPPHRPDSCHPTPAAVPATDCGLHGWGASGWPPSHRRRARSACLRPSSGGWSPRCPRWCYLPALPRAETRSWLPCCASSKPIRPRRRRSNRRRPDASRGVWVRGSGVGPGQG